MSIHISCDMYLRLGLHVQIKLYFVLPYKAKISAQHGKDFILDRCTVYFRPLIFEIFNIKKGTLFLGTEYIFFLIYHGYFQNMDAFSGVNMIHDVITTANPVPYTAEFMFVGVRNDRTQQIRR